MAKQKIPLGRGLGSILKGLDEMEEKTIPAQKLRTVTAEIANIPLKDVEPNPEQPRKDFDDQTIDELAQSIKENGIISPITVNKKGDKYIIIAGERRYRASKKLGLETIPAYIKVATELETMKMALIENIQREDLNAIEIALSLQALLEQTQLTDEELGNKIGKSRSTITNYVRLLKLPAEIQIALRKDEITMGHARSVLGVENEADQIDIVRKIKEEKLSVRQVEALVANLKQSNTPTIVKKDVKKKDAKPLPEKHNSFRLLFSEKLSSNITITRSQRGKGSINIPFSNDRDFERIITLLDKINND